MIFMSSGSIKKKTLVISDVDKERRCTCTLFYSKTINFLMNFTTFMNMFCSISKL